MKKTLKKLRSQRGLTLTEMLAAVAALTLLCLALGSGLNIAAHAYRSITAQSETELLLSTAADAITDELRFAHLWAPPADGVLDVYESLRYGPNASLAINGDGQLVIKNASTPDEGRQMLSSGVYGKPDADGRRPYKLSLPEGAIFYDDATQVFTFTLRAEQEGLASAERTFCVRCLNGRSVSR